MRVVVLQNENALNVINYSSLFMQVGSIVHNNVLMIQDGNL